jgi:choline-glycine betaine transporter
MKKMQLEIIASVASVAIFIALIIVSKGILPAQAGYGYTAALLIFVLIMGIAGLKLAEMPDKYGKAHRNK